MRLIDADALIEKLQEAVAHKGMGAAIAGILIRYIEKLPTIEAEPVRHGRWEVKHPNGWACSECGEWGLMIDNRGICKSNYCPNCGAKMDGDSHE